MSKATKSKSKPAESWSIYLGPTIRGFVTSGDIFGISAKDAASALLQKIPARFSDAKHFIIPGDAARIAQAKTDIGKSGTFLNTKFRHLTAESQKKEV